MAVTVKSTHRRYANKSSYQFFKGEKSVGHIVIDVKMSKNELINELLDFAFKCGADKIILEWNAREGFVNKEVQV